MLIVRGILVSLLAGPIMLAAGAIAAVSLLSAHLSIPDPLGVGPLDLLVDPTGGATYVQYLSFMVSFVIAGVCFFAIKWAFTGDVD